MAGKNREKQRVNKEAKRAAQAANTIADAERKHDSHFNLGLNLQRFRKRFK